jgi:hypothetical protein
MDPNKKKQMQNPSKEYKMCEKYKGKTKRDRIRNKILREIGFQNSLTELKGK